MIGVGQQPGADGVCTEAIKACVFYAQAQRLGQIVAQTDAIVDTVALPPGVDPADDPSGFEARLAAAMPYALYRAQVEARRADDPEAGRRAVEAFLATVPESYDRRDAWR